MRSMSVSVFGFFLALHALSHAQYPDKLNLRDTAIYLGDTLFWHPQVWRGLLCTYYPAHEIREDTLIDSLPSFMIEITTRNMDCGPLSAGYSGPRITFRDLAIGVYRLRFTDSSDFKIEVPDSVKIHVVRRQGGTAIRRIGGLSSRPTPQSGSFPHDALGRKHRENGFAIFTLKLGKKK